MPILRIQKFPVEIDIELELERSQRERLVAMIGDIQRMENKAAFYISWQRAYPERQYPVTPSALREFIHECESFRVSLIEQI